MDRAHEMYSGTHGPRNTERNTHLTALISTVHRLVVSLSVARARSMIQIERIGNFIEN